MSRYSILTHRKRAVIALAHSIAFGLLAAYQLVAGQQPKALLLAHRDDFAGPLALTVIYLAVSGVLWVLVRFSRAKLERLYFTFCATSASVGLLRVLVGDPTPRLGSLIRVLLLVAAAMTGVLILRDHATTPTEVLIGPASQKFDADGNLTDEKAKQLISRLLQNLVGLTRQMQK